MPESGKQIIAKRNREAEITKGRKNKMPW